MWTYYNTRSRGYNPMVRRQALEVAVVEDDQQKIHPFGGSVVLEFRLMSTLADREGPGVYSIRRHWGGPL